MSYIFDFQDVDYSKIASYAWDALWELYHTDDWKSEGGKNINKGIVHSVHVKRYGRKVFRVKVG